jgi:signal transduction histidine kinase
MSERAWRLRVRQSVFAKLLVIMAIMAACLVLLVSGVFWMVVSLTVDTVPERMHQAHAAIFVILLFVMGAVVLSAHTVIKRLLWPLRALSEGVARLGEGHLDIVVPKRSADEFGMLTDAFNRMVGRVRDMIRARDQLLLDVSHELRSPLTRLKVALELVGNPGMKARMAADVAEMEIMIGELLELERLRDGHGIKRGRQNVVSMLDEVARNFQERPPGVRVVRTPPEILADVDAERMRMVVRNLLENAIKYSPPDSRAVEVSAAQTGERVVIRVADDGPGIPERDMPNIFEPFFRMDRSRSKSTGGYGLGLSICKRVMEAHGGSIAVERRTDRGTSFVLTFPKGSSSDGATPSTQTSSKPVMRY